MHLSTDSTTSQTFMSVGWIKVCPTLTSSRQFRVPNILLTKNPGLSRTPMKHFPGPVQSPRKFKYKQKNVIYLQYSECSPLQKIHHEAKCGRY